MSIDAVTALQPLEALQATARLQPKAGAFDTLVDAVGGLNQQMQRNEAATQSLALGETANLHEVMMNMEKARLGFELLLQVRNKTLDAYQELMRMQV